MQQLDLTRDAPIMLHSVVLAGQKQRKVPTATVSACVVGIRAAVSDTALGDVPDLDGTEPEFERSPDSSVTPRTRAPVIRDRVIDEHRVRSPLCRSVAFGPRGPGRRARGRSTLAWRRRRPTACSARRSTRPERGRKPQLCPRPGRRMLAAGLLAYHRDSARREHGQDVGTAFFKTGTAPAPARHEGCLRLKPQ